MNENNIQNTIYEVVKSCVKQYWRPYDHIESEIKSNLLNNNIKVSSVFCTGEITNIFVYIQYNSDCYVYNENSDFEHAYLLYKYNLINVSSKNKIQVFKNIDLKLKEIPKVVLIALCVLDNFSVPRFNLSTGAIASYIRLYQKARVYIYDMQLRISCEEIIEDIKKISPNIIGISITFGQKSLSQYLINELHNLENINSMIVVGNIIPSLNKDAYLKMYKDIIVSFGEGEQTFIDLIDYINDKKDIKEVRGIAYLDNDGKRKDNGYSYVNMENLPFPSLDTIEELVKYNGALTIETSRGCNYSKCYFCPRDHKGSHWRGLSVDKMVEYFSIMYDISRKFNIPPFVYIADEEFIGQLPHELETKRILSFCKKMQNKNINIRFDLSARIDSIYKPNESREHNIERLNMWLELKKIGLNRLFLGVESGCDKQLVRFNKGTTALQNKIALKLITSLGINIRIGYISFDPLMENFDELKINHKFVEQEDILYLTKTDINYFDLPKIYDSILGGSDYDKIYLSKKPLFTKISYPLTSLEVLYHSIYSNNVRIYEEKHNVKLLGVFDMNMTRYSTKYVNNDIGLVSDYCQRWIDHNFPVIYALKGLYKTSIGESRKHIYAMMEKSKTVDHYLLNMMMYQLFNWSDNELFSFIKKEGFSLKRFDGSVESILLQVLNYWEKVEEKIIISQIKYYLKRGTIPDTIDQALLNAINLWSNNEYKWNKIN